MRFSKLLADGTVLPLCRARCGRTLTDPESVARGYGPVCWGRLPAEARAAISAALPPKPTTPRVPKPRRSRTTAPTAAADGQLPLDPTIQETHVTEIDASGNRIPICWACKGAGIVSTEDGEDAFECTVCEGSGLADSAGGPILADTETEA